MTQLSLNRPGQSQRSSAFDAQGEFGEPCRALLGRQGSYALRFDSYDDSLYGSRLITRLRTARLIAGTSEARSSLSHQELAGAARAAVMPRVIGKQVNCSSFSTQQELSGAVTSRQVLPAVPRLR